MEDGDIIQHLQRAGDPHGVEGLLVTFGPLVMTRLARKYGLQAHDHALLDCVEDAALAMNEPKTAMRLSADRNLGGYFYRAASRFLAKALTTRNEEHHDLEAAKHAATNDEDHEPSPFAIAFSHYVQQGLSPSERELLRAEAETNCEASGAELASRLGWSSNQVYVLRSRVKSKIQTFRDAWDREQADRDHGEPEAGPDEDTDSQERAS